ncbi:MAG: FAD-dependent oxidoreductase, partial [Anaerolineales bacterium]
MHDLVVVGAGLSGLYAGALAARQGLDVHVVARGLGGLQTGTGAISVHGYHRRRPLARPNLDRFEADFPNELWQSDL